MKFYIIESGSKGNATIVENNGRILLIDMGVTLTALKNALERINKNIYNIEALLLTHEHCDHTSGIKYLPPLPIYTLEGTCSYQNVNVIKPYKSFKLLDMKITPVRTSHDVKNPTGFVMENNDEKLVYLTDTGIIPEATLKRIRNATYYIFESNHDLDMLWNSSRPYILKRRIAGDKGHLSNKQSACYLCDLIGENTKQIVLAHLSEECNDPNIAIKTHKEEYKNRNINLRKLKLMCAKQHEMIEGGK